MGFRLDLPIPGVVRGPDGAWALEAAGPFPSRDVRQTRHTDEAVVEAAELGDGLIVRSRRAGDRMRPLGMRGSKKLQDLFVDRKIRRRDRDRVPIVTDERDRIIWVPGHALGEEFRVTDRTNAVVVLKLRRIERVAEHGVPRDDN